MLYGPHAIPDEPVISNLQQFGNGWAWDVTGEEWTWDATGENPISCGTKTYHYRTTQSGEGIFEVDPGGDEAQLTGLCQFRASGNRDTARRQIKKYFTRSASGE